MNPVKFSGRFYREKGFLPAMKLLCLASGGPAILLP